MLHIFISYRRDDSATISGRIYDYLEVEFGKEGVFKDVDDIPQGEDFRTIVLNAIHNSHAVLVIIGKTWISITNSEGYRRLDNPEDMVRQEVAQALQQQSTLVVPVLVEGARMPSPDELPENLKELAFANAAVVRNDPDFRRDMSRLVRTLKELDEREEIIRERERRAAQQATRRALRIAIAVVVLMVLAFSGLLATGTIKIPGIATETIDPFQEAFRLLTNTAEAEIASRASPTYDITQTIQSILDGFVIETQSAAQNQTVIAANATQFAQTPSITPVATNTPTPSSTATETILPTETPTVTPNQTSTTEARNTSIALTVFAQATNDLLATQRAPTNTSEPSDTPTLTMTSTPTMLPTSTSTSTNTATSTVTPTPAPTNTSTPNQATETAESAAQATAAIQAAQATLTRQSVNMTATATHWTQTPTRTPRPTLTPIPPVPFLGVLFQSDFTTTSGIQDSGSGWHTTSEGEDRFYCIDNNSSSDYPSFGFGGANWSNYSAEARVRFAPLTGTHAVVTIMTRLDTQGWGYRHAIFQDGISMYYYGGPNASPSTIVTVGSESFSIQFDTWYLLRAEVDGNEVRTYLDGRLITAGTDNRATRGKLAIEVFPHTRGCVDNLIVRSLDRSSDSLNVARIGHITQNGSRIRLGPSVEQPVLSTLDENIEIYVVDSVSVSDWILIYEDVSNIQGWISRDLVAF